jgi:hypothetical protein
VKSYIIKAHLFALTVKSAPVVVVILFAAVEDRAQNLFRVIGHLRALMEGVHPDVARNRILLCNMMLQSLLVRWDHMPPEDRTVPLEAHVRDVMMSARASLLASKASSRLTQPLARSRNSRTLGQNLHSRIASSTARACAMRVSNPRLRSTSSRAPKRFTWSSASRSSSAERFSRRVFRGSAVSRSTQSRSHIASVPTMTPRMKVTTHLRAACGVCR